MSRRLQPRCSAWVRASESSTGVRDSLLGVCPFPPVARWCREPLGSRWKTAFGKVGPLSPRAGVERGGYERLQGAYDKFVGSHTSYAAKRSLLQTSSQRSLSS